MEQLLFVVSLAATPLALVAARRTRAAILVCPVILGLVLGGWRCEVRLAYLGRQPVLETSGDAVEIEGWLEAVEHTGSGRPRLVIRVPDHGPGLRVRVRGRAGDLLPGDAVRVRAVLAAPRGAAVPGGFDFAFHAMSRGLIGTGFAIAPPVPVPQRWEGSPARWLVAWRWRIAERIRGHLPDRRGALAAALLTGDRSALDARDVDALRNAGLGHLLAISGLHMALLAGGVFFAVRAGLALITGWAAAHDASRPAALIALLAASAYLALSGAAIPTQRAYIMAATLFGAVLLRRRGVSLHTLAIALLIVLGRTPEAVISVGFQMSFAAVAALIVAARHWQLHRPAAAPFAPLRPLRLFFGGLASTSLIAGLATGGFAAFHFNRIASFGLAGNMLAMPVFTLVVMPAGILSLFLLPMGLEGLPLWVMGQGIALVLWAAHTVAAWPGALRTVAAAPDWVFVLYAAGFVVLVLGDARARLVGLGLMAVVALGWVTRTGPDLYVSESAVAVARNAAGEWQVSDRRRGRFAVRVFLEREAVREPAGAMPRRCDELGCVAHAGPLEIAQPAAFEALEEDCRRSTVIVTRLVVPAHLVRGCDALMFDGEDLARHGAALVWLDGQGQPARIRRVRPPGDGRAWQRS
ncbi:ComEC/Rec2 family competence protein [Maricaulis sp. CAU 1757]